MSSFNYPHMCRDGHIQIGYSGGDSCPICFPTPTEEPYPEGNAELFMANSFAAKGVGLSIPKEECGECGGWARVCGECRKPPSGCGCGYGAGSLIPQTIPCPECAPTPSKEPTGIDPIWTTCYCHKSPLSPIGWCLVCRTAPTPTEEN